jgi:hypothetical protein
MQLGTVRPSILRAYGRPITVPIENIINLDESEQSNVERFVHETGIMSFEHRIIFECSSKSGQSFVTPDFAQNVAEHVSAALSETTIIFSTNVPMVLQHRNSRQAAAVSLRENAALTRYCTLFVGSGSRVTVAATSTVGDALADDSAPVRAHVGICVVRS